MQFPFTFQFSVPGILNPFAARTRPEPKAPIQTQPRGVPVKLPRRLPPPKPKSLSNEAPLPLSRKRGWVPSLSEPTQSTIELSSYEAAGYFNTVTPSPGKYKDMDMSALPVSRNEERGHDDNAMEAGVF
jgi:hypothetical protein